MFILINNIPYNSFAIASFNKQTNVVSDTFGNDTLIYSIVFDMNNGNVLREDYSSQEERDIVFNNLLNRLVGYEAPEPVEEYPTNQTGEEVTLDETSGLTEETEQE